MWAEAVMLITESCRITIPDSRYRCVITHKAGGDALWSVHCHSPGLVALSGMNERLFSVLLIVVHGYFLCGSWLLDVLILPPRNHGVFFYLWFAVLRCVGMGSSGNGSGRRFPGTWFFTFIIVLVAASRCVTTCHHHVTLIAKARINQYRNG